MKQTLLLFTVLILSLNTFSQPEIVIDDFSGSPCFLQLKSSEDPPGTIKQVECVRSSAISGAADIWVIHQGISTSGNNIIGYSGETNFPSAPEGGMISPFSITYDGIDGNTDPNNPRLTDPVLANFTNKRLQIIVYAENTKPTGTITFTGKVWDASGKSSTVEYTYSLEVTNPNQIITFGNWLGDANLADIRAFQISYSTTRESHDMMLKKISLIGDAMIPTPVRLLSFSGTKKQDDIKLNWSTASEINSDYFDIEVSYDGINFNKAGRVNAVENSNSVSSYSFNYRDANDGKILCRLKMVDNDGTFTYSSILLLGSSENSSAPKISPTIFSTNFTISFEATHADNLAIRLINMTGKICYQSKSTVAEGRNSVNINNLENLAAGMYILQLAGQNGTVVKSQKLIKQ